MILQYVAAGVRHTFAPTTPTKRTVVHGIATIAGILAAVRFAPQHAPLGAVAWYALVFFGAHAAMVPIVSVYFMLRDRADRFVRSIVEEELIRFDLRTYQRQLSRVFPSLKPPGDQDR